MSKENVFDIGAKFRFARRMVHHRMKGQPRVCPYCGPSSALKLVRRKKLIMDILQCEICHLIFRWPTDTPQEHDAYYQDEFAEDTPQVVPPKQDELRALMQNNFLRSSLDINHKILVLKA
jgi:ribosomal protein L37AE/L43A